MSLGPKEAFALASLLRQKVEASDETRRYTLPNDGEYESIVIPLDSPRSIADKQARFLKVSKALSGSLVASATYFEDPELDTFPLRHITLGGEMPPMYFFNGTTDARGGVLSDELTAQLLIDIGTDSSPSA